MITIITLVGVFASYAKQLEQGWRALQGAQSSLESVRLQQSPRSFTRITDDKLQVMIADYESGMTVYELAAKYGNHRQTIMKHLSQAGVRSRMAVPTNEEVFYWDELRTQGLGFKAIAKRVGRNQKTIRKYLQG